MTIERAFGLLVSRWRFLGHHVYIKSTKDICRIIVVSCILHNLCINANDPDFPIEENTRIDIQDNVVDIENASHTFSAGRHRRDQLNRWFNQQ